MGFTIAIAGKGGTGKTTVAALIVRLIKEKKLGSILAVDADPNSNLAEALGIEVKQSIGEILNDVAAHPEHIPEGMSKDRFIEYQVQTAITEVEGFDVLVMGRPEGPGCYCYVNNVLRNIVGKLIKDYDYIVIDNEAGLEHLSRRTTGAADTLVVISDATPQGLKAAKRIYDLVKELDIKTKKNLLIINKYRGTPFQPKPRVRPFGDSLPISLRGVVPMGLDYIGNIPQDPSIAQIILNSNSLWRLNDDALSLKALRRMGDKIWH